MQASQPLTLVRRLKDVLEPPLAFMQLLRRQIIDDGCRQAAAALTYTTLFAIVPIMTVSYAILAAIPALKERGEVIQAWALNYFVPDASAQVLSYLNEFSRQANNLTAIGIVFLVVTSVLMLRTIERTMNRIWMVSVPRKGLTSLLMYWAVLTLGPLLLGAGLGISSYLTSMALVTDTVQFLGGASTWLVVLPVLFTATLLSLLYIVVPNAHVPVRAGILGGVVAALIFEGAKWGFAQFIRMAPSYEVVYGAFAAVPLFLLWIFISWMIVLSGAELVRTLVVFREHRRDVPRLQALLRVLDVLWRRQQEGRVLSPSVLRRTLQSAGATRWDEFRNLLIELDLVRRTDDGSYVLTRDLGALTLAELVQMLPWPLATQLYVTPEDGPAWEGTLLDLCQQAQAGFEAPLALTVEALFAGRSEKTTEDHSP